MKNDAFLSLGSNLGNRLKFLKTAIEKLKCSDLRVEKFSSIYETEPQNFKNQPTFLNCVLQIKTNFDAFELFAFCQKIEAEIGKNKTIAFGPRNVDIDILTFNFDQSLTPNLIIPHLRMCERNFVLTPLKEIAPEFEIKNQHIDQLIAKCANQKISLFQKNVALAND
jgi:2-amino-4-hydroxy-6-hydroxymethyldihydropteridine diphosphokinase